MAKCKTTLEKTSYLYVEDGNDFNHIIDEILLIINHKIKDIYV